MLVMRELSDKFKLSARSIGEVFEAINAMVSRCRTTGEAQYRGKNLTREALVNAAILYVDSLPPKEKMQAISSGVKRLESILESGPIESQEQPSPGIHEVAVVSPAVPNRADVVAGPVPPPAKPGSKRRA